MGWVAQQLQAGKKPNDVVEQLVRNGWHLEDAQQAVKVAKSPSVARKLTRRDWWVFGVALLGVLLFGLELGMLQALGLDPYNHSYSLTSSLVDGLIASAVMIAAFVFLISVLYDVSIKHEHPSLHRFLSVIVSGIIGFGVFSWCVFFVGAVILLTNLLVHTFPLILLVSLILALCVFCMEWCYRYLRNIYDAIAPRHPRRLLAWCAVVFALSVIVLTITMWWAQNALVVHLNEQMTEYRSSGDGVLNVPVSGVFAAVSNDQLRRQFEEELRMAAGGPEPLSAVSLSDVMADSLINQRCDQWGSQFVPSLIAQDVALAQRYASFALEPQRDLSPADLEEYRRLIALDSRTSSAWVTWTYPFRYVLVEDAAACTVRLQGVFSLARYFPAEPDMGDASQRDLVAFRLWLHTVDDGTV